MKRLFLLALTAVLAIPCAANADIVFRDNFDTANDTSINTGLPNATRQSAASSTYTANTSDSIASNTFERTGGGQTDTNANFFSALGTNDFTYSTDFEFNTISGVNWSSFSIVGSDPTDDTRGESGLSVLIRGNNNIVISGGGGAVSGAAIQAIAGLGSWDASNQHNYKFAATATDANTGTFDFLIDNIVVSTSGAYSFASSTRQLSFIQQGGVTVQFDNLLLETSAIPEPGSLALLGLGAVSMLVRRKR